MSQKQPLSWRYRRDCAVPAPQAYCRRVENIPPRDSRSLRPSHPCGIWGTGAHGSCACAPQGDPRGSERPGRLGADRCRNGLNLKGGLCVQARWQQRERLPLKCELVCQFPDEREEAVACAGQRYVCRSAPPHQRYRRKPAGEPRRDLWPPKHCEVFFLFCFGISQKNTDLLWYLSKKTDSLWYCPKNTKKFVYSGGPISGMRTPGGTTKEQRTGPALRALTCQQAKVPRREATTHARSSAK